MPESKSRKVFFIGDCAGIAGDTSMSVYPGFQLSEENLSD
jgi:hypothetical protein